MVFIFRGRESDVPDMCNNIISFVSICRKVTRKILKKYIYIKIK